MQQQQSTRYPYRVVAVVIACGLPGLAVSLLVPDLSWLGMLIGFGGMWLGVTISEWWGLFDA